MKKILLPAIILISLLCLNLTDARIKIKDLLNKGIFVEDDFTGQSFTIVKENENYYVIREIFGSNEPVFCVIKYKAKLQSDQLLLFSEVIKTSRKIDLKDEDFMILIYGKDQITLFLNKLKVKISKIK
jgi:hypothetical protein